MLREKHRRCVPSVARLVATSLTCWAQQRKLADTKHVRPTVYESVDDQQDRAHRQALLAKGGINERRWLLPRMWVLGGISLTV